MRARLSHSLSPESREIGALRGREGSKAPACCPTAFQEIAQVQMLPKRGAKEGEKAGEAACPTREIGLEAQEQIAKQGAPDLPAHGIGAVAQKIGQLECLFDLLEEDLDGPARAVKIGHTAGTPVQIVGEELHLALDSIDFDQCAHPAHALGVFALEGPLGREHDFLVGEDLRIAALAAFDYLETMTRLGAGDPENPAHEEIKEVVEIYVGFVKENDLASLHRGADLSRPLGVVVTGRVDENKAGQKTLKVEPQMTLGGRFAPTVLGPVHAGSHQFNGRRIDDVDRLAKAMSHPTPPASVGKSRRKRLKVSKHGPEKLLGQLRLALLTCMGKPVAARRGRSPDGRKWSAMESQRVANVIETNRVSQLRVQQGHGVTPRRECPAYLVHSRLSRQFGHEVRGNQIAELPQNAELRGRWAGIFVFHTLPSGRLNAPRPSLLLPLAFNSVGRLCKKDIRRRMEHVTFWQ